MNLTPEQALKTLTQTEAYILYWVCKGLLYKFIAKNKVPVGIDMVQNHMTNVYAKLGIDTSMHSTRIRKILKETFCPALQKLCGNNPERIKNEWPIDEPNPQPNPTTYPIVIYEQGRQDEAEEIKKQIALKLQNGVLDPNYPILMYTQGRQDEAEEIKNKLALRQQDGTINPNRDYTPPPSPPPQPPPPIKPILRIPKTEKTNPWPYLVTALISVILTLVIGGIAGYFLFLHFFPMLIRPPITKVITATSVPLTATLQPTEKLVLLIPTNSPTLTITPIQYLPTPTPAPTDTPLPTPTSNVLFEDDFENGLSPQWQVESGSPAVVNGSLTTDSTTWLTVGDTNWKNYYVEFRVLGDACWRDGGSNDVGVRAIDLDNMIDFQYVKCESFLYTVINGNWKLVPNSASGGIRYDWITIKILVQDNQYTLYFDGAKQTSYFNTKFPKGKVAVRVLRNTMIDNFKVVSLP